MEPKDLATYWSQIVIIIATLTAPIWYLIKRIFDLKSKKTEINHSLIQQNRINTVNTFFGNYAKLETMWNHIAYYQIFQNKLSVNEIDGIVFPPINELNKSLLELKIYFSPEDHKYFEKLVYGLSSINGKLSELYFSLDGEMSYSKKADEFFRFKAKVLLQNSEFMENLCERIKHTLK